MRKIQGNEVDIFNYNESATVDNADFKVFKFFRVTKASGWLILFTRVGNKFYGGVRYTEDMDEESVCANLANMVMDGYFEPDNEIELHARLGRKVELLDKTFAIIDFYESDLSKNKLCHLFDKEFDRECKKMPFGLSFGDKKHFYNKVIKKIAKKIGNQVGIQDAEHKGIKDMFWNCDCSFPNFDDDVYIQMLNGDEGKFDKIGTYQYVDYKKDGDKRDFVNELIYNEKWGANYDRNTHEMLGGYSEDGVTFRPDFRVTEVDEDNVPNALAMCTMLFERNGKVDMPYAELEAEICMCFSEAN